MPTRRHFLKTVLPLPVFCATPFIVPSHVVSQTAQGQTLPNDRLVMGLIGTGRQCYHHNIPGFVRNVRNQVVALCDVDVWRLAESKKKVEELYDKSVSLTKPKEIRTYTDYKELLARSDIDAVMISTPDHWHTDQAINAMKAGKHVSLEKPIIRTVYEGQLLVQTAAETKRIFRVDSEFRSQKSAHQAAELVCNGRLGTIKKVLVCVPESDVAIPRAQCPDMPVPAELDYERWQGNAPKAPYTLNRVHTPQNIGARPGWMRHLYYCDGMVTNWGTHLLNGCLWALGLDRTFPVEIRGTGTYPDASSFWNVLLSFEIHYRYKNGLEIVYKTDKPFYRIEGEKGTLTVSFDWQDLGGGIKGIKAEPESLLSKPFPDSAIHFPLRSEKEDFIDCCLTGQETLEPATVGHHVTSTLLLGHIAVRTGETITFDPDAEKFIDGPSAKVYFDKPIVGIP